MANLLRRLTRGPTRSVPSITDVDSYLNAITGFNYQGNSYGFGNSGIESSLGHEYAERITADFPGLANGMFFRNSVIFACMLARFSVFSAARFQFQGFNSGRPSELFGTPALSVLERPWVGGTTGDLLTRMIMDADLAGNSYWTMHEGELIRLRPDWVDIILEPRVVGPPASPQQPPAALGWRKLGFVYYEGGRGEGSPVPLRYDDVCHFAPIPDPLASYRGMSWLTPLIREVAADQTMTTHKTKFMENAATPNLIIKHDISTTLTKMREFKTFLDSEHAGAENAYKTMHLGGGADPMVVGSNFEQIEFATTQASGEVRIAAAAGTPPVIVGLSKGLESSTYSNYSQARRRFADGTLHPLWQNAAGSLEQVIPAPNGSRLWYDTRDIAFLREDSKDAAEIAEINARSIRTLVDGGFTPESAMKAVMTGDLGLLDHSGLMSVQLQPPGTQATPTAATPTDKPTDKPAAKPTDKPAAKPANNGTKPAAKPAATAPKRTDEEALDHA